MIPKYILLALRLLHSGTSFVRHLVNSLFLQPCLSEEVACAPQKNLPPGGPREAQRGAEERYQHFAEVVGALRAQIFRSELMHIVFLLIFEVLASGASKSG
jgi:hypothetical protein